METPISPKVIVSVIFGIILTALVSNLSAITPDMLDFLGPWKLFVFGTLITAVMGLAAWWKTDPLRATTPDTAKADTAAVEASKQTSLAATSTNVASPVSFASTQAKIDASAVTLPDVFTSTPAEVTPLLPAATQPIA